MKNVAKLVTMLLILSMIFASPVTAVPDGQGRAKGKTFPPVFLEGDRISVYVAGQTLPADEPHYVCHGWLWPNWNEYSGKERNSYLTEYWLELEIDGNPVELKKWIHKYKIIETSSGVYEDAMLIVFYVQFEAYEFEPGTYEFRGVWNGPGGILQELTVDVEFTA